MLEAAQEQLPSPEDIKGPADRPPAGPKIQDSRLLRPNPQWVPSGRRRGQLDRPRVLHSPGSPRRSLRLGQAYAAPVQLCTFDDFWRAPWPGRGMVALFQKTRAIWAHLRHGDLRGPHGHPVRAQRVVLNNALICPIPGDHDENTKTTLHDAAAFRGGGATHKTVYPS